LADEVHQEEHLEEHCPNKSERATFRPLQSFITSINYSSVKMISTTQTLETNDGQPSIEIDWLSDTEFSNYFDLDA
jgi:hypothetical protein